MPSHSHITSACLLHFDSRGRGRVLHYRYFLTAGGGVGSYNIVTF